MNNNKLTVEIYGIKYPLRYAKDSDIPNIQKAANIVDEKMRKISQQNKYLPPDKLAVLTALYLAEQLISLQQDYDEFWDILEENRSK